MTAPPALARAAVEPVPTALPAVDGTDGASRFLQARAPSAVRDWVTLTKPEITLLVVLSSLAGYALGSPAGADALALTGLLVGVALTSAGGGVLNHVLERHHDAAMHRTASRPIPSGRIAARTAWTVGVGLVMAGVGLLCPTTNWATASLAIATVVLYLYVYTPLKRRTPHNTLVGTVPGALPALGGYVAATGTFGGAGWAAFALLVFWQMPHFLSLAWMYRKDYVRGGFAMSTADDASGEATARRVVAYTLLTVAASLAPVWTSGLGWDYAVSMLVLGALMLRPAHAFARERSNANAKAVLRASVLYVMLAVPVVAVFAWM